MLFIDPEKAFHWVSNEILKWVLLEKGFIMVPLWKIERILETK